MTHWITSSHSVSHVTGASIIELDWILGRDRDPAPCQGSCLQFRGEFYNIMNHHNQYVTTENLDANSLSTPFVQTQKGGIYGVAGQPTDERRNIQFGLKLTF
jgi:hypothetical protein